MSAPGQDEEALLAVTLVGVTDVEGADEVLADHIPTAPLPTFYLRSGDADTVVVYKLVKPEPRRRLDLVSKHICERVAGATITPPGVLRQVGPTRAPIDFNAFIHSAFPDDKDLHRKLFPGKGSAIAAPGAAAPKVGRWHDVPKLEKPPADFTDDEIDAVSHTFEQQVVRNHPGTNQLAAIHPDGNRGLQSCAVDLANPGRHRAFVRRYYRTHGLYFLLNEVQAECADKRASKATIKHVRAIVLDLDPPDAITSPEALARWRDETLARVKREAEADPKHAPTLTVDSGRGIQLIRILITPLDVVVHGERAETITKAGLLALGTDPSTHDVTRLIRVPGTINFPTATKRKTGHVEPSATAILNETENRFELEQIAALFAVDADAPEVATPRATVAVQSVVDMGAVRAEPSEDDEAQWKKACKRQPKLSRLYDDGDKTCLLGPDVSGSGYAFALAAYMKGAGCTIEQFGNRLLGWEYGSDDEKIDQRFIARAWDNTKGVFCAEIEFEDVTGEVKSDAKPSITSAFQPIEAHPLATLRPREWMHGRIAARRNLTLIIAPPGTGKSTLCINIGLAGATGRDDITGMAVPTRHRVALWNQEDDSDETARRVHAAMSHFDIKPKDLQINGKPALLFASGVGRGLVLAVVADDHVKRTQHAQELVAWLKANDIGLLILDPLLEFHSASENDNVMMGHVAREFRRIAVEANCAVMVVHHTRKAPTAANRESLAGDMDGGRGASAVTGVARIVVTLYGLDPATAKRYGVPEADRHRYVRLDDAKANMSLVSGEPVFFYRESVRLGADEETVGVLRRVALKRTASAKEEHAADDIAIRTAVRNMLADRPDGKATAADAAEELIDAGIVAGVTVDSLRKRLGAMFPKDGKPIGARTERVAGRRGISVVLGLAENAE
jgi:hypothetical protein